MVRRTIIMMNDHNHMNSNNSCGSSSSLHRDFGFDSDMAMEAYGSTTFVTPNTMKRRPSLTVCTHTDDDCYNCQRCKRQKFAARKEESNISLWEYDSAFQTSKNKQNNNNDDGDEMARLCRNGYHENFPVDGVDIDEPSYGECNHETNRRNSDSNVSQSTLQFHRSQSYCHEGGGG